MCSTRIPLLVLPFELFVEFVYSMCMTHGFEPGNRNSGRGLQPRCFDRFHSHTLAIRLGRHTSQRPPAVIYWCSLDFSMLLSYLSHRWEGALQQMFLNWLREATCHSSDIPAYSFPREKNFRRPSLGSYPNILPPVAYTVVIRRSRTVENRENFEISTPGLKAPCSASELPVQT